MTKKWVQSVKTISTFPPPTTFSSWRDPEQTARIMADPKVSPLGWGSAIKMVQYFINRGGKRLKEEHREKLERAKRFLQEWRDAGKSLTDFEGECKRILGREP